MATVETVKRTKKAKGLSKPTTTDRLTRKQRELRESIKKCQEILKNTDIKPFNREEFYRMELS